MGKISYTGTVVQRLKDGSETEREPIPFSVTDQGLYILGPITIAERHDMKKSRVRKDTKLAHLLETEYARKAGDDDYIQVSKSWHRVTVFGDKAEAYAQDATLIAHGALVDVEEATYTEDAAPWVMRDGTERVGRPEQIGDKAGSIVSRFAPKEAREPVWDGISDVPAPRGRGGGRDAEVSSDEGF